MEAGIHSIEHGVYLDDAVIELMLERGTFVVPTLVTPVGILEAAEASPGDVPEYAARKAREVVEVHSESIAKAHEAGVKIAMGTDCVVVPHGQNLRELGLMCEAGLIAAGIDRRQHARRRPNAWAGRPISAPWKPASWPMW